MTDVEVPADLHDLAVEPPVLIGDQLVVECEHTECDRRCAIGTDIDAVVADPVVTDWAIRLIPASDGRLQVDGATCHNHRVDKAIDNLVEEHKRTVESIHRRSEFTLQQMAREP